MIFFRPNKKFMLWLKKYAKGRLILDVGCGEGYFLHLLNKAKIKAIGIEPYDPVIPDPSRAHPTPTNVIPVLAQGSPLITAGKNNLIIIARPCHSNFCYETIKAKHPSSEVLYIGKKENIELDLEDLLYTKIFESAGDENEVVLSIK
jgi:SAM-dependent methyltransferase